MKNTFFTGVLLLITSLVLAQEKGHFIYMNAGGGQHSMNYTLQDGSVDKAYGFNVNAGYDYFFTPHWGIGTGLCLQTYASSSTITTTTGEASVDSDGDSYLFRTYYNAWEEKQKLMTMEIPLAFYYHAKIGARFGILASVGAKASLPVLFTCESDGGTIQTTGYFEQWNVELYDMPQHNFKTVTEAPKTDVVSKVNFAGFVDLGATYKITPSLYLYGGVYYNRSFTDPVDGHDKSIYQQDGTYNGVLASTGTSDVYTSAMGLKLGIRIHLGPRAKSSLLDTPSDATTTATVKTPVEQPKPKADSTVAAAPPAGSNAADTSSATTKVAPKAPAYTSPTMTTPVVTEQPKPKEKILYAPVIINDGDSLDSLTDADLGIDINDSSLSDDDLYQMARRLAAKIKPRFAYGSAEPLTPMDDNYRKLAEILIKRKDIKLLIVGHTCDIGTKDANIKMGMKRAAKVQELFKNLGVTVIQLPTVSKFYADPVAPNTSEENRAKNRRVDLFVE